GLERRVGGRRLAHHLEIRLPLQHQAQAFPEDRVVVHQDDADLPRARSGRAHPADRRSAGPPSRGATTVIATPPEVESAIRNRPPTNSARSVMFTSPWCSAV